MNDDYRMRLNRVIDYIDGHIGEALTLDLLASVAAFSKYHFHRIFASMTGESLGAYIQRIRLEKAAALLNAPRGDSVTGIAMDLGFSSPAAFSRAFRDFYGMSPTAWRRGGWERHNEGRKLQSSRYPSLSRYGETTRLYPCTGPGGKREWRVLFEGGRRPLEYRVGIRKVPEMRLAYLRYTGPYAGDEALFERLFGTLIRWAEPRGLYVPGKSALIAIYHDSPEITEEMKLRLSVCLEVPPETEAEGQIGVMEIPAGTWAEAHLRLETDQYGDAWNSLFAGWLPGSGYLCAEGPCYELYPDDDPAHVVIRIPVEPL